MFLKNGLPITLTNGMLVDDVQIVLPLSQERLAELGIEEAPDPVRPDDRFYWVDQNNVGTPKDRDQTNALVWEWIKARRDDRRVNGGVKVNGYWFKTDATAVGEYTAMAVIGKDLPDATLLRQDWRTMVDGVVVDMTAGLVRQILAAGFAQIAAIDDAAQAHKAGLEACADPSAYDYSTGWPEIFSESAEAQA